MKLFVMNASLKILILCGLIIIDNSVVTCNEGCLNNNEDTRGCVKYLHNVEIISFHDHVDPNFLDAIEEVKGYILIKGTKLESLSMKNLRLIRGTELYEHQSIHIEDNPLLKTIIFPSLREVTEGDIRIENNPKLCFVDKVNWTDVTSTANSNVTLLRLGTECSRCPPNCSNCWSDDICQRVWKLSCSAKCLTGCVEHGSECCSQECSSGCRGNINECIDCTYFNNSGTCEQTCPSMIIHNPQTENQATNPDGKFSFENQCLKKCPDGLPDFEGDCVMACPVGHKVTESGSCEKCFFGEKCPTACLASSIATQQLQNCAIIEGSLNILNGTLNHKNEFIIPLLPSVKEVTGYLAIKGEHVNFNDLSFLENLEVIKGLKRDLHGTLHISHTNLRTLNLTSLKVILNGDIWISDNDQLEMLDFVSLKEVAGLITVKRNKKLCFIDNNTFHNISRFPGNVIVEENKDPEICRKENKICHSECFGGCWGPTNRQCKSCINQNFQGECISSCDVYPNLYRVENECRPCHIQCVGGCSGNGSDTCKKCANVKDGEFCVEECPKNKYLDRMEKKCKSCSPFCKNGCSGPSAKLKEGGCNNCDLLFGTTSECMSKNMKCKDDMYIGQMEMTVFTSEGNEEKERVRSCHYCDPQCKTCETNSTYFPHCKCRNVEAKTKCMESCPQQQYNDSNNRCQECHDECDECFGPYKYTCHNCRNMRIFLKGESNHSYYNLSELSPWIVSGKRLDYEHFECISTCPAHKSSVVVSIEAGVVQRTCEENSPTWVWTVLLILGVLCFVCVIVVVTAVVRRQKAKWEEKKTKKKAQEEGISAEEILMTLSVRLDLTELRLIKESEIEIGEKIGCGTFGTVYRGIWRPENEKVRVTVAIRIIPEELSMVQQKEFLSRTKAMPLISHRCCMRILAFCLKNQTMLITPLIVHGSLVDFLPKNIKALGCYTMLKWANQIAGGMNYLEQKGIVYKKLAARNILVQSINQLKISDIGLDKLFPSNFLDNKAINKNSHTKWLALESIQLGIFTHKSDVWSYGVTLWELFTYGGIPFGNLDDTDMAEHLEMGERLLQPPICTIDVYLVMIQCWMVDPQSRPTFEELETEFSNMSKDPGRFLVIEGDKLMRIPSDCVEENRVQLIRQMNLSDSDDIICGEDYFDQQVVSSPRRFSSKNIARLTSVMEEEETSFQTSPEYMNSAQRPSRRFLKKQSSSQSSGSFDRTLANLEAATAVFEGGRQRNISGRYLGSPDSDNYTEDLMTFPQSPRPPSLDEKDLLKFESAHMKERGINFAPLINSEDYLQPVSKIIKPGPGIFMVNPEYMEQTHL